MSTKWLNIPNLDCVTLLSFRKIPKWLKSYYRLVVYTQQYYVYYIILILLFTLIFDEWMNNNDRAYFIRICSCCVELLYVVEVRKLNKRKIAVFVINRKKFCSY